MEIDIILLSKLTCVLVKHLVSRLTWFSRGLDSRASEAGREGGRGIGGLQVIFVTTTLLCHFSTNQPQRICKQFGESCSSKNKQCIKGVYFLPLLRANSQFNGNIDVRKHNLNYTLGVQI